MSCLPLGDDVRSARRAQRLLHSADMSFSGRFAWLAFTVCGAVSQLACGPSYTRLKPSEVEHLDLVAGPLCGNAATTRLTARVIYRDGTLLATAPSASRRLRYSEVAFASDVGRVTADGKLVLPADPLPWHDQEILVRGHLAQRPDVVSEVRLTPRFDCGAAELSGADGADGRSGQDGGDGAADPICRSSSATSTRGSTAAWC